MKLASIELQNFKRFDELSLELWDGVEDEPLWRAVVLGDNGAGKTTVLQAAALCLSIATGKTASVDEFSWPGWLADRYTARGTPRVTLEVHFDPGELDATAQVHALWRESPWFDGEAEPTADTTVSLTLDGSKLIASPGALAQFRGRRQASRLLRHHPELRDLFHHLPGVFWFDQFRNLGAMPADPDLARDVITRGSAGIGSLREYLVKMWRGREDAKIHRVDILGELERSYQRLFPGRAFVELEPRYLSGLPTPDDYYFMLSDGARPYALEEMSAGEQAVFPLLYDFARQQIGHSVVLIDEIGLNLHPPLAQTLLQALPTLGDDCQYLLTAHSRAITDLVDPLEIRRLHGGRLCQ